MALFIHLRSWLFICTILVLTTCRFRAYDSSPMQFNPDGRILQIEYAKEAVHKGMPILSFRCSDGIVMLGARKKSLFSRLIKKPHPKIFRVDQHISIAVTGLLFDSNALIEVSRKICTNHRSVYDCPIPVEHLADNLASLLHQQTRAAGTRPLGVGLIIAGIDDTLGPQVYSTDPDGSFTSWKAVCLGQNSDKVEESLIALIEDNQGLNGVNVSMALRILNEQVVKKHFSHTIDQTIDQHSSDEDRSSNDEWDIEVFYCDNENGKVVWKGYECPKLSTTTN